MKSNRPSLSFKNDGDFLKYAIIISLTLHLAFLIQLSVQNQRAARQALKTIEIAYYNLKLQTKNIDTRFPKEDQGKDGAEKKAEIFADKPSVKNTPIKDISKMDGKIALNNDKLPASATEVQIKRKISVPPLKSEKISNPLYQNYYQTIRAMIKKRAYSNYSKLDTGEVYLTFVLLADGTLKQLQFIEERTSANDYLKDISSRSIKDASPFPPFPKDLSYPELSFNVVISFEEEK